MLPNFEHNNYAYKTIENAVHACVLLTKSRNAPNFQIQWFSLCKYVSIENAVVRNAHDEQKPSQNVSTMAQHKNACIRNAVYMSCQKRLQIVEAFPSSNTMSKDIEVLNMQCIYLVPKVQNEQKRVRIPNTVI